MNPLSLITKGILGDLIKHYNFPFNITIDYGDKEIDVLVEDNKYDVSLEEILLEVDAGQEDLAVTLEEIQLDVQI